MTRIQAEEAPKKEERPKSPSFLAKILAPFKNGEKKAEKKVKEKSAKKTEKKEEVRHVLYFLWGHGVDWVSLDRCGRPQGHSR